MRKNSKKIDIIIIIVLLLLIAGGILLALLPGIDRQDSSGLIADADGDGRITNADFAGKRAGVLTGSMHGELVEANLEGCTLYTFNSYTDMIAALESDKIDFFLADNVSVIPIIQENPELSYIEEPLDVLKCRAMFAKNENGEKLRSQFNEFLAALYADGTRDKIYDFRLSDESDGVYVDHSDLTGENGTLVLGTGTAEPSVSYISNGRNAGTGIDIAVRFCREYGYGLEIETVDFGALIPGLVTGIYDFVLDDVVITDEHKESVYFSEPYNFSDMQLVVRKSDISPSGKTDRTVTEDTPLSFFGDKKIGILTGSSFEPITLEKFPDTEYLYFNTYSDLNLALLEHRIDGYMSDEPTAIATHSGNSAITYLNEKVDSDSYYFLFGKTEARAQTLLKQFNEMLAEMDADGTLAELHEIWLGEDTDRQIIDRTGLTGENGTVNIGTSSFAPPFNMVVNGELSGLTIDLAYRFARKYGYELLFEDTDINGMLSGLTGGKYDILAAPFSKTPEREESADFSESFYSANIRFVVRTEETSPSDGSVEDRPFSYYAENKKIGVITASLYEVMINERYPGADLYQFNNQADLGAALDSGVIDCFIVPKATAEDFVKQYGSITTLKEVFTKVPYGFAFEKSADKEYLRDQMNDFLAKIRADGTYDELVSVWFGDDEDKKVVDTSGLTGENGTLNLITTATMQPYSYIKDGANVGFEIDIATRWCREYGYALNISTAEFSAMIPAVTSGMANIACANIMITEERAESVNFSDPYYTTDAVAVVRAEKAEIETQPGFFESIATSFEKNFIREDRWKMIVDGIGTTCFITVMSALFGSILAFLVCMFRRTGSRLANAISNIYVKLLQGTPIVVLLMILYYVVLGKSGLEAVWVAIIGFTLNFGAYTAEIMHSGIESIDGGQREAALALGYNENQAFFRFIFPQAAVRFLPVYRGEIVSLLKSTSIVGYIAIQDLTKMSDIIRSRTYEAFFPLIATAIIYFILAWIISLILKLILNAIDKRHRRAS